MNQINQVKINMKKGEEWKRKKTTKFEKEKQ
jgi:hypothetical protein